MTNPWTFWKRWEKPQDFHICVPCCLLSFLIKRANWCLDHTRGSMSRETTSKDFKLKKLNALCQSHLNLNGLERGTKATNGWDRCNSKSFVIIFFDRVRPKCATLIKNNKKGIKSCLTWSWRKISLSLLRKMFRERFFCNNCTIKEIKLAPCNFAAKFKVDLEKV